MAEGVFNYGQVTKGNQLFFLNGTTQIPGIQGINANFSNNANYIDYFGANRSVQTKDNPQVASINIDSLLIATDNFIQYTGDQGFNGYIVDSQNNTNKSYSFTSGYLTNYSFKASLGGIPQIGVGISVLGDIGRLPIDATTTNYITTNTPTQRLMVCGNGCMSLSFNEFDTNALRNFTVNISTPRIPIYKLGPNTFPAEVRLKYPIDVNVDFEMALNDYSPKKMSEYPFGQNARNLTITLRDYFTNDTINTFSFNNMIFQGEGYSTDVGKNVSVNFSYKTQIFR